jgi:proteic killer suppression protein
MIQDFKCKKTKALAQSGVCDKKFRAFQNQAEKRLRVLESATCMEDLMRLKSNHCEALAGDRKGQWSIRINAQWRICFCWGEKGPGAVEIVDYH